MPFRHASRCARWGWCSASCAMRASTPRCAPPRGSLGRPRGAAAPRPACARARQARGRQPALRGADEYRRCEGGAMTDQATTEYATTGGADDLPPEITDLLREIDDFIAREIR